MKCKVIAGAISEYEVYAKDIISLKDTALAVNFDAVHKISSVIKNGKLVPYYFHKVRLNTKNEEVLSIYPFRFIEEWEFEYHKKIDAIFFLKRDIINLQLCENKEDVVMFPQSSCTDEKSVRSVCKSIIRRSIIRENNPSIIYAFLSIFRDNALCLVFTLIYFVKRLFNKIRNVSALDGYTAVLTTEDKPQQKRQNNETKQDNKIETEALSDELILKENKKKQKAQFNNISSLADVEAYLAQYNMTDYEQGQIIYKLNTSKVATLIKLAETFKLESQSEEGKVQKAYRLSKLYSDLAISATKQKTVSNAEKS